MLHRASTIYGVGVLQRDQSQWSCFRLHRGSPVTDADRFEQIAKEADGRREHLFFAVARLKPEWSDPNTHEKGKVTTPSKDKAVNMPDGSTSHVGKCPYLGFDCDAEKYTGNDLVEAAQHYGDEGQRIKASSIKSSSN